MLRDRPINLNILTPPHRYTRPGDRRIYTCTPIEWHFNFAEVRETRPINFHQSVSNFRQSITLRPDGFAFLGRRPHTPPPSILAILN